MDHTTYKQTRDDTAVWKQIAALLFSAQQIHGNAADITRGRNEPWSLHFFYAKPKLFGIKHNYVRYGVLGGVRPLTSAFVRTSTLLARAVANAMLAKTLPASQLERNIDYLPEARILIFKILVFLFSKYSSTVMSWQATNRGDTIQLVRVFRPKTYQSTFVIWRTFESYHCL